MSSFRLPDWQDCHEMWSKLDRETRKKRQAAQQQQQNSLQGPQLQTLSQIPMTTTTTAPLASSATVSQDHPNNLPQLQSAELT